MRITGLGISIAMALAMTAVWANPSTPQPMATNAQRAKSIVQQKYGVSPHAMRLLQQKYAIWQKAVSHKQTATQGYEIKARNTAVARHKQEDPARWGHQCPYLKNAAAPLAAKEPIMNKGTR